MKKSILSFLPVTIILCFTHPSAGQTDRGKFLIGGTTSFSFVSMKNKKATDYYDLETITAKSLDFTPELGFLVAKNFAIGLSCRISSDESKRGYETYKTSSFYAIPFAQLYFGKELLKAFLYGGVGFGNSNNSETGYGTSFDNIEKKQSLYEIGGGVAAFVNKSVCFEIGAAYSSVTSKYADYSYSDRKDNVRGIGFKIGIVVCL